MQNATKRWHLAAATPLPPYPVLRSRPL